MIHDELLARHELDHETAQAGRSILQGLQQNIEQVVRGRHEVIQHILTALLAEGHILLEDYPGSGKTTLAKMLGASIGDGMETIHFNRVQFTPDLLPSDIMGVSLYDSTEQRFRFSPGPIFGNVILADEVNRAGPKVQAAMLEAMAEKQVSIDNVTHRLPELFFVIATQNPLDVAGTYPLPLVQLDRFLLKVNLGPLSPEVELDVLRNHRQILAHESIQPVCSAQVMVHLRKLVRQVHIDDRIYKAVVGLVDRSRQAEDVRLGASTRGALMLVQAMKARAFLNGRDHVVPDDFRELAEPVLLHRIVFKEDPALASFALRSWVDGIVSALDYRVA